MIQSGADLTKFNEGLTLEARPDRGKFELGYGCDYWGGAPTFAGQTCTEAEADAQFALDYPLACSRAELDMGAIEYALLSEQRQAVLNDMAYEIGGAGLAQFHDMLTALKACRWNDAAQDLKDSKLFQQVPNREARNIQILTTGEWPND